MVSEGYNNYFIRQIKIRRTVFAGILALFWIGGPLLFGWSEYRETRAFGIEKLGEERYQERMEDTVKYTLWMLGALSVLFFPIGIILSRFFRSYITVLKSLNTHDIGRLRTYAELSENWLRFIPSFIFCGDKLYLFTLLGKRIHRLSDVTDYHLQNAYSGDAFRFGWRNYRLHLSTLSGNYAYTLAINYHQAMLLQQDLHGNTKGTA